MFTDIDCGYCRKLHSEIAQLNSMGVRVRYVLYPRSGPNSASWKKAEEVWCAPDRKSAFTARGRAVDREPGLRADARERGVGDGTRRFGAARHPAIITAQGTLDRRLSAPVAARPRASTAEKRIAAAGEVSQTLQ